MTTEELKNRLAEMKQEFKAKKCNVPEKFFDELYEIEHELFNRHEITISSYNE